MEFDKDKDITLSQHPRPFKLESGPLAGKTIEFAGSLEMNDYATEREKFADVFHEVLGHEIYFMSDESDIRDFTHDPLDCDKLSRALGVVVTLNDSVIEVLRKMKPT